MDDVPPEEPGQRPDEPDLREMFDEATRAVASGLGAAAQGLRGLADRLERPAADSSARATIFGRLDYAQRGLDESELTADPLDLFRSWYDAARDAGEANAMVLATVAHGRPSSRTVLLKGFGESGDGFAFYTNYDSRKADELAGNGTCALLFPWYSLQRQVRVEGVAERVDRSVSEDYFASRPRESQLGAWASVEPVSQSGVVADRAALEAAYDAMAARFDGGEVPCPPTWGGYVVRPDLVEFWQGRTGRMHDRLRYRREGGSWVTERLAP